MRTDENVKRVDAFPDALLETHRADCPPIFRCFAFTFILPEGTGNELSHASYMAPTQLCRDPVRLPGFSGEDFPERKAPWAPRVLSPQQTRATSFARAWRAATPSPQPQVTDETRVFRAVCPDPCLCTPQSDWDPGRSTTPASANPSRRQGSSSRAKASGGRSCTWRANASSGRSSTSRASASGGTAIIPSGYAIPPYHRDE
jgi:hypothetical protein